MVQMSKRPVRLAAAAIAAAVMAAAATRGFVWAQLAPQRLTSPTKTGDTIVAVGEGFSVPKTNPRMLSNLTRSLRFSEMTSTVNINGVHVTGKVDLYETNPTVSYVWLLRVYEQDNKQMPLFERHYLEQIASVSREQPTATPTFEEVLPLMPGSYKIELSYYGVPANFAFERIAPGQDLKSICLSLVFSNKRVTVDAQ